MFGVVLWSLDLYLNCICICIFCTSDYSSPKELTRPRHPSLLSLSLFHHQPIPSRLLMHLFAPTATRSLFAPCTCSPLLRRPFSFSFSSSSSLSRAGSRPPFQYTKLVDRSLLPLSGIDAPKFLQGLISNDIHRLGKLRLGENKEEEEEEERLLFAGILKADVSAFLLALLLLIRTRRRKDY